MRKTKTMNLDPRHYADHELLKTMNSYWLACHEVGIHFGEDGFPMLELRNCYICESTLARPITANVDSRMRWAAFEAAENARRAAVLGDVHMEAYYLDREMRLLESRYVLACSDAEWSE